MAFQHLFYLFKLMVISNIVGLSDIVSVFKSTSLIDLNINKGLSQINILFYQAIPIVFSLMHSIIQNTSFRLRMVCDTQPHTNRCVPIGKASDTNISISPPEGALGKTSKLFCLTNLFTRQKLVVYHKHF